METTSDRKINITKKILEVQDDSVLDQIEQLLSETEIVAYTSNGEPLTKVKYIAHIEKISTGIQKGDKTYTSEEVKNYILNRK
ncbi:hypothetical protein [Sinomicrobium sp. M5D2P17]